MAKIYKTIDLCAGIGGIRKGYELAKCFKNVLSAEIDKNACLTYQHLYGDDPTNDITTDEFKDKVAKTKYDVLLAGFPCQAFSRAGKKEGFLDKTRGTLFFDIADIIKRTEPKAFMLENVDNLITHDKGQTFHTILSVLINELDYKVIGVTKSEDGTLEYTAKDFVRNSRNFGVPQNRPRVYIMGFSRKYFGDKVDSLPNALPIKREKKIYEDLNDLLEMNADDKYFLSSGYVETLERHKARHEGKGNGFGYRIVNLPEIEHPVSNAILATGGSGKERNLVIDSKEGVAGKVVPSKQTPLNDKGIRAMTPREWGKLQGFINYAFIDEKTGKDTFSFPDGLADGSMYKQFGNAVTIPAVEVMAKFMKKQLAVLEQHDNTTMNKGVEVMTGNVGEWSELYTLFKLLADGKLYAADAETNKIPTIYYDVLKVLRSEKDSELEYSRETEVKVINAETGEVMCSIPISSFIEQTDKLLLGMKQEIENQKQKKKDSDGSFALPEVWSFAESIKCKSLKAKSQDKADIHLMVHDIMSGRDDTFGFSIKSQLGSPSTLFNASGTTNLIYAITGHTLSLDEITKFNGFRLFKQKFEYLHLLGSDIEFDSTENEVFDFNLKMVTSEMTEIFAVMIKAYYEGKASKISDLTEIVAKSGMVDTLDNSVYLKHKLKNLLTNIALGMVPGTLWTGDYEATGGYIIVKEDGDVVCYHIYNHNAFMNYMFDNTRFDTPSQSRHGFGKIYEENGRQMLKLNVQIRFVK